MIGAVAGRVWGPQHFPATVHSLGVGVSFGFCMPTLLSGLVRGSEVETTSREQSKGGSSTSLGLESRSWCLSEAGEALPEELSSPRKSSAPYGGQLTALSNHPQSYQIPQTLPKSCHYSRSLIRILTFLLSIRPRQTLSL